MSTSRVGQRELVVKAAHEELRRDEQGSSPGTFQHVGPHPRHATCARCDSVGRAARALLEPGQYPIFSKEIASLVKANNGGFEALVCQIAVAYSKQVLHDWQVFLRYILSRA